MNEITVTVKDSKGKTYSRSWKNTANKIDAIKWTITSEDVPHYLNVSEIVEVAVN